MRRLGESIVLVAVSLALAASGCGGGGGSAESTVPTALTQPPTTTTEPPSAAIPDETGHPRPSPPVPPPPVSIPLEPDVTRIAIVVRGGGVVGGIKRATVEKGADVVILVTSDVADEVHLHGYDRKIDVIPGKTGRLRFEATARGRFEVELEDHHLQIADLTVK